MPVTNTIAYEIKNIIKCLKSGYNYVLVVSNNEKHLNNIRKQAISDIDQDSLNLVHFIAPSKIGEFLDSLSLTYSKSSVTTKIKGYRVKVNFHDSINSVSTETIKNDILKSITKKMKET